MRLMTAALAVLALLLVACGGSGHRAQPQPVQTSAAPGTTTQATQGTQGTQTTQTDTGGIDAMTGASTSPVEVAAKNKETALLTAVRVARHEGYDRVVFEFKNALPGYAVRYVTPPVRQDGSGKVVPVKGAFVVQVRMNRALDADLSKSSAPMTYQGPLRFSPSTPEVAELVRSGGFEGVLTWVAGLRDRVDFRAATLTGPPRLVVDFRNH